MLILLKLTCFGLWLAMMLGLILAGHFGNRETYHVTLQLADPEQAEYEIKSSIHQMIPRAQLCLKISCQNPCWPELLSIASRLQRTNPSIIILTEVTAVAAPWSEGCTNL